MTDKTFHKIKLSGEEIGVLPFFSSAKCVLVGFSGGADSSLLLEYLLRLRETLPEFPEVAAIHVNHCLRGAESDRDEQFCRDRCDALGVRLTVRRADVPAMMAESGMGAEECAREARYAAFREARLEMGGGAVLATAHNADDNLETVLFNLARGGGAAGLSGIPPVRDGWIVRPLLGVTSSEIREMCAAEGIPYVTDSTNGDERYTRNFIRQSVVPLLRQVNPAVADAALRCGVSLREDEAYLRGMAAAAVSAYLPDGMADLVEAPKNVLTALPLPVQARALAMLCGGVTDVAMSAEQIRLCRRLMGESGTARVSLSDGVTFEVSGDLVRFFRGQRKAREFSFEMRLPDFGECVKYSCPEVGFDLLLARNRADLPDVSENIYKLSIHTAIRFDTIYGKVFARSRLPGDVLHLGGHHRKIKKMLCERDVPVSVRERLPVICDERGIVAVPGLPVRGDSYTSSDDGALIIVYLLYRGS